MKDKPSHMKKFMEKMTHGEKAEEIEEPYKKEYAKEKAKTQIKKQKKIKARKIKEAATHTPETPEEKNRDMKKRTPRIRERSHKTSTPK